MQPGYPSINQMPILNFAFLFVGEVSTIFERLIENNRHLCLKVDGKSLLCEVSLPSFTPLIRKFIGTVVLPFGIIINSFLIHHPSQFFRGKFGMGESYC